MMSAHDIRERVEAIVRDIRLDALKWPNVDETVGDGDRVFAAQVLALLEEGERVELLQARISGILSRALKGPDYRTDDGYVRWGLVDSDIRAAILHPTQAGSDHDG